MATTVNNDQAAVRGGGGNRVILIFLSRDNISLRIPMRGSGNDFCGFHGNLRFPCTFLGIFLYAFKETNIMGFKLIPLTITLNPQRSNVKAQSHEK